MSKRLLLISNSTNYGEDYLAYARQPISDFLGKEVKNVAFVPYAAVSFSYIEYVNKVTFVFKELGYEINSTENTEGAKKVIEEADAIVVGGGNTFHLVHLMHEKGLMDVIKKKVENGTPYIGWSAGSNAACPSVKTTNDMPVIQPVSFNGLSLVPFQINPHYTDAKIPNHNGESREDRIREYLELNPESLVVGLKEGTMLKIIDENVKLIGNKTMKIFRKDLPTLEYDSNSSIDFIMK